MMDRQRLRRMVPLAALMRETVLLERDAGSLRGACPLHPDPPNSLQVDEAGGFYRCFSCLMDGDAVAWIMRRDALSESEAIATLERRAGSADGA